MHSAVASGSLPVLTGTDWRAREAVHHDRVDRLLAGHLDRARRGERHPVEDFLFTYYSLRPAQLRRWHPGAGVVLADAPERAAWRDHAEVDLGDGVRGVTVDVRAFARRRGEAVAHVRALLTATASRPAQLGCFGLHEWAMVYRQTADDVRHRTWPLRLGHDGTDAVVEAHRIRCTHFDAYRFFTPAAAPRNALRPSRATTVEFEQPGCLHATMDLYKLSYKLQPAVPSGLVADAFELARDVRVLDMRASPYDLSALGYEPVRIETPEGKAEYVAAQRAFAERGAALRLRLLAALEQVPV
ncbi:MAG TPA: 3-methyladenine DNA glycosylase [Kineosporiaceae bacterium]|nr:3-methyladenine DNA glycosylase [Kineosporiaceae bacterium]